MSKVLVVGDIHEPVSHPGYLSFCKDLYERHNCDKVVFIGDVVDLQAISFHVKNPQCPGPDDEYLLAKRGIKKWRKAFPEAIVTIGNHDERVLRLAETVGIPARFIRNYSKAWGTPKWEWVFDVTIDGVYYFHGTMNGGMHPAWNAASKLLCSTVVGHNHCRSGVKWRANPHQRVFALDTGCGIDVTAFQFAYGKHIKERPILSAAVILDGIPHHEIMACDVGEKYNRSNFITNKYKKKGNRL